MAETRAFPPVHLPMLVLPGAVDSALPLERTRVNVHITGPLVSVVIGQHFTNPLKEAAELDYLFPLPEEAAVSGFELRIGTRHVQGDLQESEAARTAYEDARQQGKRSGLFEQRRPNLFAVRLANILPGEAVDAEIRYQERVKFNDGEYEFVFPMGLTPKYDRPDQPQEGQGTHAPLAKREEKIGPVEIQTTVDAGFAVAEPTSPSHAIEVTRTDARRFQLHLAGENIPDHDFVLRYALVGDGISAAGWTSGESGKEFFLATLVPARLEEEPQVPPREFIFVLDRSGSMTGEPIAQARNALRACLRTLNPEDTFRILLFDNQLEWFRAEAAQVTQAQVEQADAYLDKVQGRGGTEILGAIDAVLSLASDSERTRFIVFLTDGAVSAEAQALEQIRARIGAARLFSFGVGPSVNRALLSRMARLGRGRAEFMQLDEDIEGAIIRFQDSVSFPLLINLSLEWQNGKAWDVYPVRLPDLYSGEPVEFSGRLARNAEQPLRLVLRGERAGQPVALELNLYPPAGRDAAIERVWAQARVEDFIEQQELEPARAQALRDDILGLALEYNLVTRYTAFVAIDQDIAQGGGNPRVVHVALPLPKGLSPEGFQPQAQMARLGMALPAAFMPAPAAPGQAGPGPLRKLMTQLSGGKTIQESAAGLDADPSLFTPFGIARESAAKKNEPALRQLARTQNLDGSWKEEVEQTAAALLAFVRAGYTPRSGSFRQALRRAAVWLASHPGTGFAAFARALAFAELARATGEANDQAQAQTARLALPAPSSRLEKVVLGGGTAWGDQSGAPGTIQTLDDLRLAGILGQKLAVPRNLLHGEGKDLVSAWSAVIEQA
jgi:Ca-activated chloride channel homolog